MPTSLTLLPRPMGGFPLRCSSSLVCSETLHCSDSSLAAKTPGTLTLTPNS